MTEPETCPIVEEYLNSSPPFVAKDKAMTAERIELQP